MAFPDLMRKPKCREEAGYRNNGIQRQGRWLQVSRTLIEEYIGFEEINDLYITYTFVNS